MSVEKNKYKLFFFLIDVQVLSLIEFVFWNFLSTLLYTLSCWYPQDQNSNITVFSLGYYQYLH